MATYTSSPQTPPQYNNGGGSFLKKSTIIWGIVGLLVIILFVGGCSSYNGMVKGEEAVNKSWAYVQEACQRRLDLITNLVNTVKGAAAHESNTLQNVTNARQGIIQTGDSILNVAQTELSSVNNPENVPTPQQLSNLNRATSLYINAVHEAYPQLTATQNFKDLQQELESTENRINTERNKYSDAVEQYNVSVRSFPRNIFAGLFGFQPKQQFAASQEAQNAPSVQF